ncbi:MAG: IS66 family transposase [Idiomarina sp.]
MLEKDVIIGEKSKVIQSQKARIAALEELLQLHKQKRFGRSSEQQPDQLGMFDEAETTEAESDAQLVGVAEKKKPSGRKGLNPDIARVQQRIELSDDEKAGAVDTYFVKIKEELDIVPARVQVIELLQEKAVFQRSEGERTIVAAQPPKHPLPKAVASTNTLAYVIIAKYMDALPLYRQEKILARYGGSVTRTTLANWLIRLSVQLTPLINLIREHQWEGNLIQADETRTQVLKEPGRSVTSDKWMWLTRGGPPDQPSVLFEYDPSRSQEVPLRLLDGFHGCLQTDGYAGYNAVVKQQGLTHIGCWDHARRKFEEAEKAASGTNKKHRSKASTAAPSKARVGLSLINKLYVIERAIKDKTPEEKYEARQQESLPVLNKLRAWLDKNERKVMKDSLTWVAINYTLNQWDKLVRYCDHGEIPISNILAENAIRPFCVGRRNWLFSDTPKGANASALYYSLIETAKANGLEPYDYFRRMLKDLPYADTVEKLEALLPWNYKKQL